MSTPDGRTTQYRIIITIEGGVVQSMDGIPMNTVVEVRDYDTDGMTSRHIKRDESGCEYLAAEWDWHDNAGESPVVNTQVTP